MFFRKVTSIFCIFSNMWISKYCMRFSQKPLDWGGICAVVIIYYSYWNAKIIMTTPTANVWILFNIILRMHIQSQMNKSADKYTHTCMKASICSTHIFKVYTRIIFVCTSKIYHISSILCWMSATTASCVFCVCWCLSLACVRTDCLACNLWLTEACCAFERKV